MKRLTITIAIVASLGVAFAFLYKPKTEIDTPKTAQTETQIPAGNISNESPGAAKLSYSKANDLIEKKPLTKEDIEKYRAQMRERLRQKAIAEGKLAEFEAKEAERQKSEEQKEMIRQERKKLLKEKSKIFQEMRASAKDKHMSPEERRKYMERLKEVDKKLRALNQQKERGDM